MNLVAVRDQTLEFFLYFVTLGLGLYAGSLPWPFMLSAGVLVIGTYVLSFFQNNLATLATILLPMLFFVGMALLRLYLLAQYLFG